MIGKWEFGRAYTGSDAQVVKCFHELIAYVSGMSYEDPESARETFADGFRDYDGFVREIQRTVRAFEKRRGE